MYYMKTATRRGRRVRSFLPPLRQILPGRVPRTVQLEDDDEAGSNVSAAPFMQ
jgi:hypothetical protein